MPVSTGSIAFLGAARFQGFWDASANDGEGANHPEGSIPEAITGSFADLFTSTTTTGGGYNDGNGPLNTTASQGDYWQVSTAGTFNVDGVSTWNLNDWIIYSGSTWQRLGFEDTIASIIMGDLSSSSFHMGAENDEHVIFASGSVHSGSSNFVYDYADKATYTGILSLASHVLSDQVTINVPTAAGGNNQTYTIMFIGNDATGGTSASAYRLVIGESTSPSDGTVAETLVDMINGYTGTGNGTYGHNFAASGDVGGVGIPGLTAELQGSTGVTLTADKPGTAGNSIAIANAAGDVAQATALAGGHNGKLKVAGTLYLYDTGGEHIESNGADLTITAGEDIVLSAGVATTVTSGKFGVGTDSPNRTVSIYRDDATTTAAQLQIEQDGTGDATLGFVLTGIGGWAMGVDNSDSDKFKLSTDADILHSGTRLTVDTSGNVGIGNTAPGSLLEISKVSGDASIELSSWSATDGDSGTLIFQKSSIATVNTFGDGSGTAASETLGRIEGWGATQDLTAADDIAKLSSYIEFANDAASREGTVPGKIVFATAPNSDDATPVIRLTIDDGGLATFANSVAITTDLDVDGTANLDAVDIDGAVAIDPGASSGVGLTLTHTDTDAIAYAITASNQDANVMNITADALTTGNALNISSDSSNNNTRALLKITNDNTSATGTKMLHVLNDAVASLRNLVTIESTAAETGPMLEMKNTNAATDKPILLTFARASTTVADDMSLGRIAFEAMTDAAVARDYVTIDVIATDKTNFDQGGKLTFNVQAGGTAGSAAPTNLFSIGGEDVANATQCEVVVNDAGINCDFRVEGDNVTSLFHIDASADKIGIGNSIPGSTLEVTTTAANSESTRPTIEISSFSDADDASTSAGVLKFHKSANDTVNTYGANSHTAAGEVIGRIEAWGVTNDDDASSDAPKLSSYIEFAGDAVADETDVPGKIIFATADADDNGAPTVRLTIDDDGHVTPGGDNTQDLGSSSYRWANLYTGDLHLKNERGDWTIVEEEEYLCVVNNKTGKKYKMMLQEIEGGE